MELIVSRRVDGEKRQVRVKQVGVALQVTAGLSADTAPTWATLAPHEAVALAEGLKVMANKILEE